ncbi:MAG TPA: glycosyltransferase [Candidatus Saccharimonadales bacterium]|nr:glycosyltransferase [Candidatus Saccharimonadales bacterium]
MQKHDNRNALPLVSVLMITYNHEPYIREAIESVLRQETDFRTELLIGEDCSTDATEEIVADYAKRYPEQIRLITSDSNVGMHQNLARLEAAIRGAYVAFCEGDDCWHDTKKLAKQIQFLEAHEDYSMVHTNYHTNYITQGRVKQHTLSLSNQLEDANAYEEFLNGRRTAMTLTVCVRADLYKKAVEENKECTDTAWPMGDKQRWLELSRLGRVKYLSQSMATYNVLGESASRSRSAVKVLQFRIKAKDLLWHYLNKYPCSPAVAKDAKRRVLGFLIQSSFEAAEWKMVQSFWKEYRQYDNGWTRYRLYHWLSRRRSLGRAVLALLAARQSVFTLARQSRFVGVA